MKGIKISVAAKEKYLLRGISVQDVNSNKISPSDIIGTLGQLDIDYKRIKLEVVAVDLVDNIEPHDDVGFCKSYGYKKATFVVTHCISGRNNYSDSCVRNYLYSDKVFTWITSGYAYTFNPKKEHAVMVSGRIKGFVIFY